MLSDHEWKRLREVERDLRVADPRFHRSFDVGARRLGRRRITAELPKIAIVTAVVLGVFMVLIGSWGGACVFAVLAGLVWLSRAVR